MECPEARDLLLEALTGTTPPDARRTLRAHLASCAACRQEAAALEETASLLRAVPEPRVRPGYWAEFMAALDRALAAERCGFWRRVARWVRDPVHAWSAAAAASAVVVALVLALFLYAAGPAAPPPPAASVRALVTDAVVDALPAMTASLTVWKASLGAAGASDDLNGGP